MNLENFTRSSFPYRIGFVLFLIFCITLPATATEGGDSSALRGSGAGDILRNTSVFSIRPYSDPVTQNDVEGWRETLITNFMRNNPSVSRFFWGDPSTGSCLSSKLGACVSKDPIIAYGMNIDENGVIRQFIGRAATESDVRVVQDLAMKWYTNFQLLDPYLDETYPYDPAFAALYTGESQIRMDPDSSQIFWQTTIAGSEQPQGMQIGRYSLKGILAGTNWTLYALETEVMPVPGSEAFGSGYLTEDAKVRHQWNSTYSRSAQLMASPQESIGGMITIDGTLTVTQDTSYVYRYMQSQAEEIYWYGFSPGTLHEHGWPGTIFWSLSPHGTDPADFRGYFNPASVVAVKTPAMNRESVHLVTVSTSSGFKNAALGDNRGNGPQDMLGITMLNPHAGDRDLTSPTNEWEDLMEVWN